MFCRKCGKTLLDGDRFCSYCGAQVIERQESVGPQVDETLHKETTAAERRTSRSSITDGIEEVVYNHHPEAEEAEQLERNTVELSRKTIAQSWQDISQHSGERPNSVHWNLEGFPLQSDGARKTEDIQVDWSKRQLLKFEPKQEDDVPMESETAVPPKSNLLMAEPPLVCKTDSLQAPMPEEPAQTEDKSHKPDIFDLFEQQRQEEAPKEKDPQDTLIFHRKGTSIKSQPPKQEESPREDCDNINLEKQLFPPKGELDHTPEEEQINKFYTFSQKNEEFQKLLDKEYERLKRIPEPAYRDVAQMAFNLEKLEQDWAAEPPIGLIRDTLGAMPALGGAAGLVGGLVDLTLPEGPEDTESPSQTITVVEPEASEKVSSVSTLEHQELPLAPAEKQDKSESQTDRDSPVQPVPKEEETTLSSEGVWPQQEGESAVETSPQLDELDLFSQEERTGSTEASAPSEDFQPLPWDSIESPLQEFIDEDKGKKLSPALILLAIIIALLAFEITVLGIKYFAPETKAATFINDRLGLAVNWVDKLGDDQKQGEKKKTDQQETADKEVAAQTAKPSPVDTTPNQDKNALVEEALNDSGNINIQYVMADATLAYDKNRDYGNENINNSQPIENNIWYEKEDGSPVYYDKEIVKTLIQFDSAWINYVNQKDEAVFDFLKEGSSAYKDAKNSSLVGKVTETFDTLRIGEIRQGASGFYLWAYEEITITKAGKPKTRKYNYIYYLEPIEKQMKVVRSTSL
ncbi:zinc ribbon domain-containing protein [Aminipila butyrica]|uniref:Zinc ribbon domain-containing protein n=1 Tax=Aminipila butyrica TaxID=433296 RepID=A0A858BRW1_9FIRM|nr:zinc ribbon domain-containing protein [Aminipila butyrica]QIB67855.1 zinc ribbon domain-containing protein [Aminipila butyrica]